VAGIDHDYREVGCEELGNICVDGPPPTWEGPVGLFLSTDATEPYRCPNDEEGIVLGAELSVELPADPCGCSLPPNACTIDVTIFTHSQCYQVAAGVEGIPMNTCFALMVENQTARARTRDLDEVLCVAGGLPLPAPFWETRARICGSTPVLGHCSNSGVCAPAVPGAQQCIMRRGELDCPPGSFTERHLLYEGFNDTRRCECGTVSGFCGGQVGYFASLEECESHSFVVAAGAIDACAGPFTARYVEYRAGRAVTMCEVTPEEAYQGTIEETSPVTLCCQPIES
jgi:hypothetical protein